MALRHAAPLSRKIPHLQRGRAPRRRLRRPRVFPRSSVAFLARACTAGRAGISTLGDHAGGDPRVNAPSPFSRTSSALDILISVPRSSMWVATLWATRASSRPSLSLPRRPPREKQPQLAGGQSGLPRCCRNSQRSATGVPHRTRRAPSTMSHRPSVSGYSLTSFLKAFETARSVISARCPYALPSACHLASARSTASPVAET